MSLSWCDSVDEWSGGHVCCTGGGHSCYGGKRVKEVVTGNSRERGWEWMKGNTGVE